MHLNIFQTLSECLCLTIYVNSCQTIYYSHQGNFATLEIHDVENFKNVRENKMIS